MSDCLRFFVDQGVYCMVCAHGFEFEYPIGLQNDIPCNVKGPKNIVFNYDILGKLDDVCEVKIMLTGDTVPPGLAKMFPNATKFYITGHGLKHPASDFANYGNGQKTTVHVFTRSDVDKNEWQKFGDRLTVGIGPAS